MRSTALWLIELFAAIIMALAGCAGAYVITRLLIEVFI